MDCQTAREKIDLYIDGVLNPADIELLLAHVEFCPDCRSELDDMLRLHKALASLGEVEPPAGLAAAAARKARRRRGMPFAYISVGVAAAMAFILVLTSGILPQLSNSSEKMMPESYMMVAPADGADNGTQSERAAGGAAEAPAAAEQAEANSASRDDIMFSAAADAAPEETAAPETGELMQGEQMVEMAAPVPSCIVYVTTDNRQTEIRAELESIITEHDIEPTFLSDDALDTISFIVPEAAIGEVTALVEGLEIEGEIAADTLIEFRFAK
jgi:predicted anti-sigma-YlaC factor YlaD